MGTPDLLREAIASRAVVELVYRSDAHQRVCHPHILYQSSTGKILVDTYQVGGYSSSDPLPGWRPFDVSQITSLRLRRERFDVAPGYNPANRKRYVRVLAAIQQ